MTANPYEDAARERKADALASVLDAFGMDPDGLVDAPTLVRLDAAEAAGVNTPSEATWQLAVRKLRGRQDMREMLAIGDPFEGLAP